MAFRDAWAIQISGLEAFDVNSVRHALMRNRTFRMAQKGEVDDAKFLAELRSLMESGIRTSGYPDATVTVTMAEDGRIHVHTNPGSPWSWGRIRVEAPNDGGDLSGVIRFLDQWNDGAFRVWSGLMGWKPSSNLNTSPTAANLIAELAESAAKRDLLEGFQCKVEFEFHSESREVVPVVRVSEAGVHTRISEVVFEGNTTNSDELLRNYLQIPDGVRFTGELQSQIRTKLLGSGRFLHVSVACDTPFAEDHAVPLRIRLHERTAASPLNEALPEYEAALCRLAFWLSGWEDSQVEFQLKISSDLMDQDPEKAEGAEAIITASPEKTKFDPVRALGLNGATQANLIYTVSKSAGLIVQFEGTNATEGKLCNLGVLLSQNAAGLFDLHDHRRWTRTGKLPSITSIVRLVGTEDPERPRAFFFGPGFTSSGDDPVYSKLDVEPAALIVEFAEEMADAKPMIENGVCSITNPKFSCAFETDTGRLLHFRKTHENYRLELRCGVGLLRQQLAAVSGTTIKEEYLEGREVSTLLRFVLPYVRRGLPEQENNLLALIERSLSGSSSLDRIYHSKFRTDDKRVFSIPSEETVSRTGEPHPWFMQWIEKAATPGSPVDRLLVLLDDDLENAEILASFMEEFQSHEDIGPASCLLLAWTCGGVRRQIANEGLRRLDYEYFRHDVEMIFEEGSAFRDAATDVIQLIRDMSDAEVEVVAQAIEFLTEKPSSESTSATGLNSRMVFALIRTTEGSADQVFDSLMEVAWNSVIRTRLQELLATAAEAHPGSSAEPISVVPASSFGATDIPMPTEVDNDSKPSFFRKASADPASILNRVTPKKSRFPE